ncbi:MAG: hypothetical protein ABSF03_24220, partial [Streptosporangiaceae bacterium]
MGDRADLSDKWHSTTIGASTTIGPAPPSGPGPGPGPGPAPARARAPVPAAVRAYLDPAGHLFCFFLKE